MTATASALQRLGLWSTPIAAVDDVPARVVAPAELGSEAEDVLSPLAEASISRFKLMIRRLADARYASCDWTELLPPSAAAPLRRIAHAALCLQLGSPENDRSVLIELFVERASVRVGPLSDLLAGAEWTTLSDTTCAVLPAVGDSGLLTYLRSHAHRRYHSRTFNCQHFAVDLHEQLQRWCARQVHPLPPFVLTTALWLSQKYGSALSTAPLGVAAVVWLLVQACDPAKSRGQILLFTVVGAFFAWAGSLPYVDNDVD